MRTFRPRIELLEDRTVPATLVTPTASHLIVTAPLTVQANQSFNVVVEAATAANKVATGFTGTVHVSLLHTDTGAIFPATFTFSASDHGMHTITVMLSAAGSQSIKATSGTLTGQATLTVSSVVTHFGVYAEGLVTMGSPTAFSVVALNASNQPVANYTGTVHFSANDASAVLPANYTFTSADAGSHLFEISFESAGSFTLTVNDTAKTAILGTTQVQVTNTYAGYGYGYGTPNYYGYGASNYYPYSNYYGNGYLNYNYLAPYASVTSGLGYVYSNGTSAYTSSNPYLYGTGTSYGNIYGNYTGATGYGSSLYNANTNPYYSSSLAYNANISPYYNASLVSGYGGNPVTNVSYSKNTASTTSTASYGGDPISNVSYSKTTVGSANLFD